MVKLYHATDYRTPQQRVKVTGVIVGILENKLKGASIDLVLWAWLELIFTPNRYQI